MTTCCRWSCSIVLATLSLAPLSCAPESNQAPVWANYQPAPVPAACAPPDADILRRASAVYVAADLAVHELIVCGQAQIGAANGLLLAVLRSNAHLAEPLGALDLPALPEVEALPGARFVVPMPAMPGATFIVQLHEPDGTPITVDPFRLDSYLQGVTIASEMPIPEWILYPTRVNTFTFTWSQPGPLVHLLAGGDALPNPFTLDMTLLEAKRLLSWQFPRHRLGPFAALADLRVVSTLLLDLPGAISVTGEIVSSAQPVEDLALTGEVTFDIAHLTASGGGVTLRAADQTLVASGLELAGELRYQATGGGLDAVAQADFGGGALYPEPRWSCDGAAPGFHKNDGGLYDGMIR